MTGKCGLCRKSARLRSSHLMPAAIYKLLQSPTKVNPHPVVIRPKRSIITSKQVSSSFLCHQCEQLFSDKGERDVIAQCARPNGEFGLRASLETTIPSFVSSSPDWQVFDVEPVLGDQIDRYLYFAASVLWRAAAHRWEYGGSPVLPIVLGAPYQEHFRKYLLGEEPFPSNVRLHVHVANEPRPDMICTFPCTSRHELAHRHRFNIPGVAFTFFVGGRSEALYNQGALNGSAHCMWLCPFRQDALFEGFCSVASNTQPRGSLINL